MTELRSVRFYRRLLHVLPPLLRREAGDEMAVVLGDALRAAQSRGAVVRVWGSALADLLFVAIAARWAPVRRRVARRRGRSGRWGGVETVLRDARYAARALTRAPGFTAVVVLTLGLGIGANTAIFSLVNTVLLRPMPFAEPERLVSIYTAGSSGYRYSRSSLPDLRDAENLPAFESLTAYFPGWRVSVTAENGSDLVEGSFVDGSFFATLGVEPLYGRLLTPADDTQRHAVAVVSHAVWRSRWGGDPGIVGTRVEINGRRFEVVGVTKPDFQSPDRRMPADVWLPLAQAELARIGLEAGFEARQRRWLLATARLSAGATLAQAQSQLTSLAAALAEDFPQANRGMLGRPEAPRPLTVVTAREATLGAGPAYDDTVDRARLMMVTVGLVLLIAVSNVANLLIARARSRRREIAIRLAVGANRGRVVRQLLTESTMLGVAGGVAGLGVAAAVSAFLVPLGLGSVLVNLVEISETPLDPTVLVFTFVVSVITGIVFGTVPALQTTRHDAVSSLKSGARSVGAGPRRFGWLDGLAVVQVAATCVLLVGAGSFVRSFRTAGAVDLGYTPEDVLVAGVDPSRRGLERPQAERFYADVIRAIEGLPGVTALALAGTVPVDGGWSRQGIAVQGYEPGPGEDMALSYNVVTAGYFETLQIGLVRGRDFLASDNGTSPVAIVNETFVENYWPGLDPIGRRVGFNDGDLPVEVVGVVADSRYHDVREDPRPFLYFPLGQDFQPGVVLAVRTAGNPMAVAPSVFSAIRALDPSMPVFDARVLTADLGEAVRGERHTAALVGTLGMVALMLALVGVYGVLSYLVSQRKRELGVRAALGASQPRVLRLVLSRGMAVSAVGVGLGGAAVFALAPLVEPQLHGVGGRDPVTLGGVAFGLVSAALLASFVPARRAARVDPMVVLRDE